MTSEGPGQLMTQKDMDLSDVNKSRPGWPHRDDAPASHAIPEQLSRIAILFWDETKGRPWSEIEAIKTALEWQIYYAKMDQFLDKYNVLPNTKNE